MHVRRNLSTMEPGVERDGDRHQAGVRGGRWEHLCCSPRLHKHQDQACCKNHPASFQEKNIYISSSNSKPPYATTEIFQFFNSCGMFYIVTEIHFLTTRIILSLYCAAQNLILLWHLPWAVVSCEFYFILFQLDYKSQEIKKKKKK